MILHKTIVWNVPRYLTGDRIYQLTTHNLYVKVTKYVSITKRTSTSFLITQEIYNAK